LFINQLCAAENADTKDTSEKTGGEKGSERTCRSPITGETPSKTKSQAGYTKI
jgi:hypothetical protein